MVEEIKIPKERVPILIGKAGETKKAIEKAAGVKLTINSNEGIVSIKATKGEDRIKEYELLNVIKAIGRGFNPTIALKLLEENYVLEILDIGEYLGTKKKGFIRIRGRIIGKEGKARKIIEELTNTHISVFGKTVAIIGTFECLNITKRAIEMLLRGSTHNKVYAFLERQRKGQDW